MYLSEGAVIQTIAEIADRAHDEIRNDPINTMAEAVAAIAEIEGIKKLLRECGVLVGDRGAYLRSMAVATNAQDQLRAACRTTTCCSARPTTEKSNGRAIY